MPATTTKVPHAAHAGSDIDADPLAPRKGIFWDKYAKQFGCRIGYKLDEHTGQRVRDVAQRLGRDENHAIIGHAQRQAEWNYIVSDWPRLSKLIRPGLPAGIRDVADLSKPVWLKPEWFATAKVAYRQDIADTTATSVKKWGDVIDAAKDGMRRLAAPEHAVLDTLPDDLRNRLLLALQPPASQARGVNPAARKMTIRQAVDGFLAFKRSKVGLKIIGKKRGGGIKSGTLEGYRRELNRTVELIGAAPADKLGGVKIGETDDLNTLTASRLEKIRDYLYGTCREPRTAWNFCKLQLKPMLDWAHRQPDIDYRIDDEQLFADVFALPKPPTKLEKKVG